MKYDWEKEVREVKKYSHRSVDELSELYRKNKKNLNIKFAYMQRLYYGDNVEDMDEDSYDYERAMRFHYYNEDEDKAMKLLDELLKVNHGSSMVFYANDYVFDRSLKEQREILNKAIDLGFLPALDALADTYDKESDEIKVYKRGMEVGYPGSYVDMAHSIDDDEKEDEYIRYAADVLNYGLAQEMLASHYQLYEEYDKCFEYYLKASLNGDSRAMIQLGKLYEEGKGTEKNLNEAIKWYKEAMEYGEEYGTHNLAMLYLKIGKEKEGFNLLYSNKKKTPMSMAELGRCYRDGIGCKANEYKAFECFDSVIDSTWYEYAGELAECYYKGIGVDVDYEAAYEYVQYYDPIESDNPKKFKELKEALEVLRCPHCGEFNTKVLEDNYEICSSCKKRWNEMILNSKEKLVLDELEIDGVKFIPTTIKVISKPEAMNYLRYISKDNTDNYDNCDYVMAFIGEEYVGSFIGESILNPIVKAYAGENEPLYSLRILCAKDDETLKIILKYIEKLARARQEGYIDFNNENKGYEEFYEFLRNYEKATELDNYIFVYAGYRLKGIVDGSLEIRPTYMGEEYDIGKEAPLDMEDGETNLGYIESNNLRYTYSMDYLVIYDKSKKAYEAHRAYLIGEGMRVTDTETYNCFFIKDIFIYEDSELKYELADKLFDFLIKQCEYSYCKYIKIKIVDNKHFSYFYDYCKNNLGMIEKEGYLIKKIDL